MKPLVNQLEDELKNLWNYPPLNGSTMKRLAPEVTFCLGAKFDDGDGALANLLDLVRAELPVKQSDALLSAFGLDVETLSFSSVDDRFAVVATRYGQDGWPRTGRRWAMSGIEVLARVILETYVPSVLLGININQEDQEHSQVEIEQPHVFGQFYSGFEASRNVTVQKVYVRVVGEFVLEIDLFGGDLPVIVSNVDMGVPTALEVWWTGELGLGVSTSTPSGTAISVTTYPRRVFVTTYTPTEQRDPEAGMA